MSGVVTRTPRVIPIMAIGLLVLMEIQWTVLAFGLVGFWIYVAVTGGSAFAGDDVPLGSIAVYTVTVIVLAIAGSRLLRWAMRRWVLSQPPDPLV